MEDGKDSSSFESDSPEPKQFQELAAEDNLENYDEISDRKVSEPENGSTGDDETEHQQEYKSPSEAVDLKIQSIRQKMDYYNQHVSGLLEEGKNFFLDAASDFEKQVVIVHQKQTDKWEREIDLLRSFDAVSKELNHRLADTQAAVSQLMDHLITPAVEL